MTAATTIPGLEERRDGARGASCGTRRRERRSAARPRARARRARPRTGSSCCRALAERYRVLVPDLPGHGGSGRAAGAARRWPTSPTSSPRCSSTRTPARRSSPGTRSAGSWRCGSRSGGPTSCAACCSPRRRGSARGRGSPRRRSAHGDCVRPGRWVAPLRYRYAERLWYRRALFRPWFVSDALALSARAALGFLEGLPRARRHAHGRPRDARRRPARDLEHVALPVAACSGARATRSCRSTTPSSTRGGCARGSASSRDCGHLVIGERPGRLPRRARGARAA